MVEFELKPLKKYTLECPKCGKFRDKRHTKTLTVYRDDDGFIRWQCNHAGQCEWNERQYAKDDRTEALGDGMDNISHKPVKFAGELPKTHEGNQVWWYKNNEGEVNYGVMRKDLDDGKVYYPVSLQEDGKTVQLPHWPAIIGFYGQENLSKSSKVLVVEGEKTRDAAQALFPKTAVITWRGGSGNISSADWLSLKEKTVYLWPDNDDSGRKVMQQISERIENCEVYLVDVAWVPKNAKGKAGDLADNLDPSEVQRALKEAKLIKKPLEYFSTIESIEESAKLRSGRYLTGWPEVDSRVHFPMSGMIVIEGRTGHGKTAMAINLAKKALDQAKQVYYFSFEIPEDEVIARIARIAAPDRDLEEYIKDIATKEYRHTCSEIADIDERALRIVDPSKRMNASTLKSLLNQSKMKDSLVVIDYAQKIPTNKVDIRQGLVDLMDQIELISKEHSFLVIMLCQLTPNYPDPLLDAPAESKSIHYNADMVLRVWKKHDQWTHPVYDSVPGNFVMDVRKNRNGESDQLIGFLFEGGARLEPNDSKVKAFKPQIEKNRTAIAIERISELLETILAKDVL